jgi:hypothetical protein
MGTLALTADERVVTVVFASDSFSVPQRRGRTITVPPGIPDFSTSVAEQRANWQIAGGGYGIHWPDLDEDLSREGLLRGAPSPRVSAQQ